MGQRRQLTLSDHQDEVLRAVAYAAGCSPAMALQILVQSELRRAAINPEVAEAMGVVAVMRQQTILAAEHERLVKERRHLRLVNE